MTRRIRVKLDFTLVLDHDVEGIDDDWASIPWALTLAKAYAKKLGIVEVTRATRALSVVQEKPKRVRKPRTVRKLGPEFDALADSLPDLPHGLLAGSGQGLMTPKPGEPECSQCGAFLMFSARQRGDGLCGPCSRDKQVADEKWALVAERDAANARYESALADAERRLALLKTFNDIYCDESKEEKWGPLLRAIGKEVGEPWPGDEVKP